MSTQSPDEAYPRLETEGLVLRALRLKDADFLHGAYSDQVAFSLLRKEWNEIS